MLFKYVIIISLSVAFSCIPRSNAASQSGFTIYGHLSISGQSQAQTVRLLTAKLYPPKESGKPVLLAYPDHTSSFKFSNLPADSYLLEIHLGDQLLYQRLLKLESNILLAIPVGNFQLVEKATIEERKSQSLKSPEFQSRLTIKVGDIDRDLEPNTEPLSLTILQGARRIFSARLTPPKLVANFRYNGRTYILTGSVRRTPTQEFIDCEVYR